MKLTLIGYGTRGDVQPMLALAWRLKERGHEVRLLAPVNMRTWVEAAGIDFAAIPVDTQALFAAEEGRRMLAQGSIGAFFAWLGRVERAYLSGMREAVVEASADAEAIIAHALMEDRAAAVGAARRIPVLPVYFFPLPPSRSFASPFITTRNLGPLNRLTHRLLLDMLWRSSKADVAEMRAGLGAEPAHSSYTRQVQRRGLPAVLAYSRHLFPTPADYGPNNRVVGSFAVPQLLRAALGEEGLPAGLDAWLARGEAPVFLGFGSMPVLDAEATFAALLATLRAAGRRGILAAGWSTLARCGADDRLFVVPGIDHDAIFPRCAAVVHHGGSGTVHAGLRAGRPTLVCSVFADQPFWGERVRRLGAGDTIRFADLSGERLAAGLNRLQEPAVLAAAGAIGARMTGEDALEAAIRVVEEDVPGMPPPL